MDAENSLRNRNTARRLAEIIEAAADSFAARGIDSTSMQDLADQADIGIATLYRYFGNKQELAVEAALLNWKRSTETLFDNLPEQESGFRQLRLFMDRFLDLYDSQPDFFRFLENFDNYIVRQVKRPEKMIFYEEQLKRHDSKLVAVINRGKADGSIRSDEDLLLFYQAAAQALVALAQKMLLRGRVVAADQPDKKQLLCLKEMILDYIQEKKQ